MNLKPNPYVWLEIHNISIVLAILSFLPLSIKVTQYLPVDVESSLSAQKHDLSSVLFLIRPFSEQDNTRYMLLLLEYKVLCIDVLNVQAFDDLLLMKIGGHIIYHGSLGKNSIDLVHYFEVLFPCSHSGLPQLIVQEK